MWDNISHSLSSLWLTNILLVVIICYLNNIDKRMK